MDIFMAPTQFKLTEPNGLTRRVSFSAPPTWRDLASRIEALYGIPLENVSVAYLDSDGDQVTLSSQAELEDFYRITPLPIETVKFTVQDLFSIRGQKFDHPFSAFNSTKDPNPFSADIEDDWQSLPIPAQPFPHLFAPRSPVEGTPHAFLELVESEVGDITNPHEGQQVGNSTVHSTPRSSFFAPLDKGKQKAEEEDDVLSTASILAEDAPLKHPVHVYDISSRNKPEPKSRDAPVAEPTASTGKNTPTPDKAQEATAQGPAATREPVAQAEAASDPTADPPLPSVDASNSSPSPSLPNDIASFLNLFHSAINGHPELSEGFRNIIRNASSGRYWTAHREAVSQAAQDIAGAADQLRKDAEAEAAKRVADALGSILQTLLQIPGVANAASVPAPDPAPTAPPTEKPAATQSGNGEKSSAANTAADGGPSQTSQPHVPYPPWLPPAWAPRVSGFGFPPFTRASDSTTRGGPHPVPPPPPPPIPWPTWSSARVPPPPPPPPPPPFPPHMHMSPATQAKLTAEELKVRYEEAKLHYKTEKQRLRAERDRLRHKLREDSQSSFVPNLSNILPTAPPAAVSTSQNKQDNIASSASRAPAAKPDGPPVVSPVVQPIAPSVVQPVVPPVIPPVTPLTPPAIAVQGRRGNPTLEVVSVHRNNTFPSHGRNTLGRQSSRGHGGDFATRTTIRIMRRLGDMGFTENAHPNLAARVRSQLPTGGVLTNEVEDNVVTTLLEELLAMSPRLNATSGENIPGAWH